MRKIVSLAAVTGLALTAPMAALAADGIVPFNGTILAACVLTVGTPGILGSNTDHTQLSSTASGGAAGTIAVLATGTIFKISAIAPSGFTLAPTTGGDNVTFSALYSASGATTIGSTPGATQTSLNNGLTNVSVNLSAVKSAGNFTAGNYTAQVIVRCE